MRLWLKGSYSGGARAGFQKPHKMRYPWVLPDSTWICPNQLNILLGDYEPPKEGQVMNLDLTRGEAYTYETQKDLDNETL